MIKKIWSSRKAILEGLANSILIKEEVEAIANLRTKICQDNLCGFYDAEGTTSKVVLKGSPACSICGCNIHMMTRSLSTQCSLHEIGKDPLWLAILSQDEENNLPK